MSQALLISQNEVICNLYEINLRAYIGTNISTKEDYASAKDLLENAPYINAIIAISNLESDEVAIKDLEDFIEKNNIDIPLIVVSNKEAEFKTKLIVKNKYDIRSILQIMAKTLEITAKEMAQKPIPKFFPIPIRLIKTMKSSEFDIYYRSQNEDFKVEYFKIIEKDSEIADKLNKYIEQGVRELFVDSQYRLKFINRASASIINELDNEGTTAEDTTTEEKVEIISQVQGLVAEEIYESKEISEKIAKISNTCIKAIHETVKDVPNIKKLLSALVANKSDYVYKHSVLATYFAHNIIDKTPWGSKEQKEKVAFAFFFHDLFLVPILKKYPKYTNEEDLLFDENLTNDEKETVLDHAKLAGQLVKTFPKCPIGVDMIITQHHGMTSGKGFSTNFKEDISPLSKIMIISENISSYVLTKLEEDDKEATTDKEAILKVLHGRYNSHAYRKIIEAFAEVDL